MNRPPNLWDIAAIIIVVTIMMVLAAFGGFMCFLVTWWVMGLK